MAHDQCIEMGEAVDVGPVRMLDLATAVLFRAYLKVRGLTNNDPENVTIVDISQACN